VDRYWQAYAVADPPATPDENAGGFPSNGNPLVGISGTVPGEWWYHAITEELRNATIALGASPDFTKTDQLATALLAALAHVAVSINYADLIGAPQLAAVATSGDFADLANTPPPFVLHPATTTVLGGVIAGPGTSIAADGTLSALGSVREVNFQPPDAQGNCIVQAMNAAAITAGQVSLINNGGATSGNMLFKSLENGTGVRLTDHSNTIEIDATPATFSALGAVKPGPGLLITLDGTLSTAGSLVVDLQGAATVPLDLTVLALGWPEIVFNVQAVAPSTTFTIINPPEPGSVGLFVVIITNVAGASITWPASVMWPGGTTPTPSGTTGRKDTFVLYTQDGGRTYYGFVAGQNQ
jgi:hypothetical protein